VSTELENPLDTSSPDAPFEDTPFDDTVEVRRDGTLSGIVGGVAALVAVGYLQRAVGSGSSLDWVLFLVTGTVAAMHLAALADSRAPLVVLDDCGFRIRRGATWEGVAWPEIIRVEHRPRRSLLRDGSLTVVDRNGRELGVRLSLSTRLVGADWHELTEALGDLSDGNIAVLEVEESVAEEVEPTAPELEEISPTPSALRDTVAGRRTEVVLEREEPVAPMSTQDTSTIVFDQDAVISATAVLDPVVGPELCAARNRIGLSVDQLAERTRIRPHVIESIEVDDFGPCGGDFYARGHLRTLARILGVDAEPLLTSYDERYSDAPIDPRRVFEAELATGTGSIRGTGGGLNWSVLVAAVMAVVLVWSIARLVMDGPVPLSDRPVLNGSPGGKAALSGATTKVPVEFTAVTGGARVIVRDGKQQVVFDEELPFMQTARLSVVPPVNISSSDGGLQVSVDGEDEGALGATGEDAKQTFVVSIDR